MPEVQPPGQRLLLLDLVEAEALARGFGLGFAQAVRVGIQLLEQRVGIAFGGGDQGLGQRRRHLATDAGSRQAVEQDQATEVTADAAGAHEAREKFFQEGESHVVFLL